MPLTLQEARERASRVSQVSYAVELDLRDPSSFVSTTTVRFRSGGPATFLELASAVDPQISVNGGSDRAGSAVYDGARIALTGLEVGGVTVVVVRARLPYTTGGDGMNTFTDPVDGQRYVGAYLGLGLTQRVFACFDQPDIKASIDLAVLADPAWTVLANGRQIGEEGGRANFATTPPIPVSQFVVCAGLWDSRTFTHAGLPFGWHVRRSLAAELDRDLADLVAVTTACFDHYARIFDEAYAFDSYDQVFVPGQNWGAQETPGCVMFRDEMLPRGQVSSTERTLRASVIAHEMAHMWFGNLVTMQWYEDIWLNESFADYMGYQVAADAAGYDGALLAFESRTKPSAYDADARRSTHPVAPLAEEVPDVDAASANFDAISYAKGNAVLRQLATWLGEETFLAGINSYLSAHRFGNATLSDFLDALDGATDRDVRGWSRVWLQQTGFDTIRVRRDGAVQMIQRDGVREHRLSAAAYDQDLTEIERRVVDVGADPVRLDGWDGLLVLPNVGGETYAQVRLDPATWSALAGGVSRLADPMARMRVWACALAMVRGGDLPVQEYLSMLSDQLPAEDSAAIVRGVLDHTGPVLRHAVPAGQAAQVADVVAAACLAGLERVGDPEVGGELCTALARTSRDAELLGDWLHAARTAWDSPVTPALRWAATARLAEIGVADLALIAQLERGDTSAQGALGAARARAARPDPAAKEAAWSAMVHDDEVSNRMFLALAAGLWSPEQAGLLEPYVSRYFEQGNAIARRQGQSFAQLVGNAFPALALTADQVSLLDAALEEDLHPVLRRAWSDRRDDLAAGEAALPG